MPRKKGLIIKLISILILLTVDLIGELLPRKVGNF